MTKLEVTPEQWESMQSSECCLIRMYVRKDTDTITRAWVEAIGTREECESEVDVGWVICPTELKLKYDIVRCAELEPPIEHSK